MLTSTFIHVSGIGYATECKIWELGALTWAQYVELHDSLKLSDGKKALVLPRIEESIERLDARNHRYFAKALPSKEHWRAIGEFGSQLAYLDIETTGCNWDDHITIIGLYDGANMRTFVRGENLDEFPRIISQYSMLVTFFGSGFDLPVIKREFPSLTLDQLHVDLCFMMKRLGLSGGLKRIETLMGITRCPETDGLDGFDAVRLWREYRKGSRDALELLLLYNKEDVMNMAALLTYGCAALKKHFGWDTPQD
jgi:uncharacterized protein